MCEEPSAARRVRIRLDSSVAPTELNTSIHSKKCPSAVRGLSARRRFRQIRKSLSSNGIGRSAISGIRKATRERRMRSPRRQRPPTSSLPSMEARQPKPAYTTHAETPSGRGPLTRAVGRRKLHESSPRCARSVPSRRSHRIHLFAVGARRLRVPSDLSSHQCAHQLRRDRCAFRCPHTYGRATTEHTKTHRRRHRLNQR